MNPFHFDLFLPILFKLLIIYFNLFLLSVFIWSGEQMEEERRLPKDWMSLYSMGLVAELWIDATCLPK